jgi:hypothetical protein
VQLAAASLEALPSRSTHLSALAALRVLAGD